MSLLNINVQNIPDGTYKTILQDPSDNSIIFNNTLSYNSGIVDISLPSVPESNQYIRGVVFDNNLPHSLCAGIGAYTEGFYLKFNGISYGRFENDVVIGTNDDFEIEFSIFPTVDAGTQMILANSNTAANAVYLSGLNVIIRDNSYNQVVTTSNPISINQYSTISIKRISGNVTIKVNGVDEATGTLNNGITINELAARLIGQITFNGLISNLKITNITTSTTFVDCPLDRVGLNQQPNLADSNNNLDLFNVDHAEDWFELQDDGKFLGYEQLLDPDFNTGNGWVLDSGAYISSGRLNFVDNTTSSARQMGFSFGTEQYRVVIEVSGYNGQIIGVSSNTISGGFYVNGNGVFTYNGSCDGSAQDRFRLVSTNGGLILRASLREILNP